jgi:hypothetical protein
MSGAPPQSWRRLGEDGGEECKKSLRRSLTNSDLSVTLLRNMARKKRSSALEQLPIPLGLVERRIYLVRGHKVMLDSDLAELYQVETRALIQAVKRNSSRFPDGFMFQLTAEEHESLKSQFVISNAGRGGRRYLPYAFTEHGVVMLSSVLNSDRAIRMNIVIIRAFVRLREMLGSHKDLARKIESLERKYQEHDQELQVLFKAIKKLLEPPPGPSRRPIGFGK